MLRIFRALFISATPKETDIMPPLTPLSSPPVAPHGNAHRSMWLWGKTNFDTDTEQQDIVDFCGIVGCDTLFLDAYGCIGAANWDITKLKQLIKLCHDSGIKVFASWGNVDWGTNHAWVQANIIRRYEAFQAVAAGQEKFDGMILDVEYWTDEGTYPPSTNLPGLLDLVKSIQQRGILCGLFAAFYLKDNSETRTAVSYNGKSAQDGEHMMDVADFTVVGAYRDTSAAQIPLFQPWYDYASAEGNSFGLYCGTETTDVSPSNITYFGSSKSAMESAHSDVTDEFKVADKSAFLGMSVHDYGGWDALS
jgi:hypothetical protein